MNWDRDRANSVGIFVVIVVMVIPASFVLYKVFLLAFSSF